MKVKPLVFDKKQHDTSRTTGKGNSVTFHITESFQSLPGAIAVVVVVGNDNRRSMFETSNMLDKQQQVKTKRQSTTNTGGGHVVALAGRHLKKLSQPFANAGQVEPEIGIGYPPKRIARAIRIDKLTLPLSLPLIPVLVLLLSLLANCCMTLHSIAGMQSSSSSPPQSPPLPAAPVRSAALTYTSESILAAAKSQLLIPVGGQLNFIDSSCKWSDRSDQVELLVMILKCDARPMIRMFEDLMFQFGGPKQLRTFNDLLQLSSKQLGEEKGIVFTQSSLGTWFDLMAFDSTVNHFFNEAMYILSRRDFCTYQTVLRLSQLKLHVLGSRLLSYAYDLISINYHSICLAKALSKLPKVPYLVRDVVNIYIDGVDKPVHDLNQSPLSFDSSGNDEFKFNVEAAIAKNGPLKSVTSLLLLFPFNVQNDTDRAVEAFKNACKDFLIELDERWQSMEMMSKMLSTDGNGIERFNNYVMRTLVPTKHADVCSQLCAVS